MTWIEGAFDAQRTSGIRQRLLPAVCFAAMAGVSTAFGQSSSASSQPRSMIVEGTVTDQSGGVLPGVSVVIMPAGGGVAKLATTDQGGTFLVDGLAEGSYRVDLWLAGFKGVRRNHVRPTANGSAPVDAVLALRPVCECVGPALPPGPRTIAGQVVDEAGHPLPHARLELIGPGYRETAYADNEGRFSVRPPADGSWSLTAGDSGFAAATTPIDTLTAVPLVLRPRSVDGKPLPDHELFDDECVCPGYFLRPA